MSLMRGRLFAGALFVGVLFGQQPAELTVTQNSGGDDSHYERRIELNKQYKAKQLAKRIEEQNIEIITIVQTLVVTGILEQLSTEDLTITWQT